MPALPGPGDVTVAELNRNMLTYRNGIEDSKKTADDKLQGFSYPKISIKEIDPRDLLLDAVPLVTIWGAQPQERLEAANQGTDAEPSTSGEGVSWWHQTARSFLKKGAELPASLPWSRARFPPKASGPVQVLGWHGHKQWLAVLGPYDRIMLYDLEDRGGPAPVPGVLAHEFQRQVAALEWRPQAGGVLAIACRYGVCLWTLSAPVTISSGPASSRTRPYDRQKKTVAATMVYLRAGGHAPVTGLAWSPDGRLLASACQDDATLIIWDVATGSGTPLRRGLAGISLVKWAPSGDYLVTATSSGAFYLWETDCWTSEPWASTSGTMVSAMWSPDGQVLLAAFEGTTTLAAIHFAGRPPSLDAHLLPVELPEVEAAATAGEDFPKSAGIEAMAWDGSGERLAVSYKGGDAVTQGLIAVYDTRRTPVVAASLVGFIRGPAEGVKPLAFSFHEHFKRGALLVVGWSNDEFVTYPFLFRSKS